MSRPFAPPMLLAGLALLPLAPLSGAAGASAQAAAAPASPPAATPESRFGERIDVQLLTVTVRVVGGDGTPVEGLTREDFVVRVGRQEVPVAAVDWFAGQEPAPPSDETQAESAAAADKPVGAAPASGKLVIFFIEADNNAPSRVRGHLHTLPFTRELLAALRPEDEVAVVSFDSHLKLWQDFTRVREAIPAAIFQAIRFGGRPPDPPGAGASSSSLARHLDFQRALNAASPERALQVTAEALGHLPGEKVLIFLGWGLGTFSSFGTYLAPAFEPAVLALKAARATVFALDVTEADAHNLEFGLRAVAEATGGTFDKTNLFPALAMRQLARTISGYYVLTLHRQALPPQGGWLRVELRTSPGTVLLRPRHIPTCKECRRPAGSAANLPGRGGQSR